MLNNTIEDKDIEKLIKKVRDKTKSNVLADELQKIKDQGYPVSITFAKMVQYLEDFFDMAVNRYRGYGRLMSQSNYVNELNRGGGKDLHRQIGLILKTEIYNNPRYLSAGNFKMLSSVSELKETSNKKILSRKLRTASKNKAPKRKSLFSKFKSKVIKPIKHAIKIKRF